MFCVYIIGIDIAKWFHEVAVIDRNGKVIVKRIRFLKLIEAIGKLDTPDEFGMEYQSHSFWSLLWNSIRRRQGKRFKAQDIIPLPKKC